MHGSAGETGEIFNENFRRRTIVKRTLTLISFLFLLNARITAQEICPAENISVLGGDGQNIVMWDEPLNPFTV
ncbi:MAG: hypothetical protein CMG33_06355, partial [Candidatus Marinimicrobia bacterium]|nr:hypothetical protein [Candidatus Neomarinimicrobiota bacterium]